jgi:hypothetical protein
MGGGSAIIFSRATIMFLAKFKEIKMKLKRIEIYILLLVIVGLAVSAVLVGHLRSVTASSGRDFSRPITLTTTLSTEEVGQKEQVLGEIQDLFLEREKELLKPGWLHIVYGTKLRSDVDRGYLTDGVPFPNEYIIEDWYFLDEENYAVKGITFMRDLDGNFLQKSALIDGAWINTTLADRIAVGKFKPSIDLGYLSMAKAPGTVLDKIDESQTGDNAVVLYEIKADYSETDKDIQQNIVRLFFDKSGNLIKTQTVLRNVDGAEVVEDTTEVLLMENVQELPEDISEYYREVEK